MIGRNDNFYGLDKREQEALRAWLNHEEAKYLDAVLSKLTVDAERSALKSPEKGEDWNLFSVNREQSIGKSVAFRLVADIKRQLTE